jgi:hypothetical protein
LTTFSLFDKPSKFDGIYAFFIVNRFQMLYLVFLIPTYLLHPFMIWGIVAMAIFSQLNIWLLCKWLESKYAKKGYQGFVELFGVRIVRLLTFIGLILILIKITVITLGYLEIIHEFIFPSMNSNWIIFFILLTSSYVASLGMKNTIRFVVIVFLCVFWIIFLYYPFLIPPIAALHDLYPLIPTNWTTDSWKGLLLIWSSYSGPEYLICFIPWIKPQQNMRKYLTYANALSTSEYLLLFIASLFFFGSNYLSKSKYPIIHMIRYLQSPIFERLDIILISLHMFVLVFAISIFLLCIYGATRIILKKTSTQPSRMGFAVTCIMLFLCFVIVNNWIWSIETEQNILLNIQIWLSGIIYFIVPTFLLLMTKLKGRVKA